MVSSMIAGIDPGRWKTGVAFAEGGELLFSAIVPSEKAEVLVSAFKSGEWGALDRWGLEGEIKSIAGLSAEKIYIGGGTSSKEFTKDFPLEYITADEYGTTLAARQIYWRLHRPRGIMKLIPTSLRTPPRNVDDLAAYAIILKACAD